MDAGKQNVPVTVLMAVAAEKPVILSSTRNKKVVHLQMDQ